jgi:hypothetical protein
VRRDALTLTATDMAGVDMIIGNLPWSWHLFQPLSVVREFETTGGLI